ncbi:hypothetical protein WN51_10021 [Melipona quadrifasciata]|uniref:Uncharacterized protein n=1 Tax=Melipona quadrifasciata TaxID=166423 RepID=A0A0M9ACK6_9HYME|nr:hypothetical protein WN51_10021 [Melipona quadrifasciata]
MSSVGHRVVGAIRHRIESSKAPAASGNAQPQVTLASPATSETPVPRFRGRRGEWGRFRDRFEYLVTWNDSLSDLHRYLYLKQAVKGEAARAIKYLPVAGSSFEAAWKVLRERYENTNELVDYHLDALFDFKAIRQESPTELRQLLDDLGNHTHTLASLGQAAGRSEAWLIRLTVRKLDAQTRREWRRHATETDRPKTLSDLTDFLEHQYRFLATDRQAREVAPSAPRGFVAQRERKPAAILNANEVRCPLCSDNHSLSRCETFNKLAIEPRRERVRELRLCFNCLRPGHGVKRCTSSACQVCRAKHHTLLHRRTNSGSDTSKTLEDEEAGRSDGSNSSQSLMSTAASEIPLEHVLLSTAMVNVTDARGRIHEGRALLDQDSQVNLVKEDFARRLGLKWDATRTTISGVGATTTRDRVKGKVRLQIASRCSEYKGDLPFLVMRNLTAETPNFKLAPTRLPIPSHLILADPQYYVSRDVDLIIGNGYLGELRGTGHYRLGAELPWLSETQLG